MELYDVIEGTIDDVESGRPGYKLKTGKISGGGVYASIKELSTGKLWEGVGATIEEAHNQLPIKDILKLG